MARFVIKHKRLGDAVIRVDDCDAYLLRQYVWTRSGRATDMVISRTSAGGETVTLQRAIMGGKGSQVVCHRTADHADFRRANLAVCASRADAAMYRVEHNRRPGCVLERQG